MKLLITGHRLHKLAIYDTKWIKHMITHTLSAYRDQGYVRGYAGMASGVDLWFCQACLDLSIPYVACIPFDEQGDQMSLEDQKWRAALIDGAAEVRKVKNSWMVEQADNGLVVWDGNKGGTHNVVQQLVEKRKGFWWINPVGQCIWRCFE